MCKHDTVCIILSYTIIVFITVIFTVILRDSSQFPAQFRAFLPTSATSYWPCSSDDHLEEWREISQCAIICAPRGLKGGLANQRQSCRSRFLLTLHVRHQCILVFSRHIFVFSLHSRHISLFPRTFSSHFLLFSAHFFLFIFSFPATYLHTYTFLRGIAIRLGLRRLGTRRHRQPLLRRNRTKYSPTTPRGHPRGH